MVAKTTAMLDPDEIEKQFIPLAEKQHVEEMRILRLAADIIRRRNLFLPLPSEQLHQAEAAKAETPSGAPRHTGLSQIVRELYLGYTHNFTIRTLASDVQAARPDLAAADNFKLGISAVLGRDAERGDIILVTKGAAGKPSVYRNKTAAEINAALATGRKDLSAVDGAGANHDAHHGRPLGIVAGVGSTS